MPGLEDIVGQPAAVAHLERLLAADRLPHSLLFVGPSSTGKGLAARTLAQVLFCHAPNLAAGETCGSCSGCVKMLGECHGDYHEVTVTTKTIPVGAIRDATRQLVLQPIEGGAKFLLIEDAERMNASAQNALLKTLEEPPGHTHIIITTSRLRAILPTVVSRCQRVHFAPLPTESLTQLVAERRGLPTEQAHLLAALSQGSLGVAMEMDYEVLIEQRDQVARIDEALEGRTPQSALDALAAAADLASDRTALLSSLDLYLVWLHDQILIAAKAPLSGLANMDRLEQLESLAQRRGLAAILARASDVMEAKRQVEAPFNWNPQMIAEQLCLALAGHNKLERLSA